MNLAFRVFNPFLEPKSKVMRHLTALLIVLLGPSVFTAIVGCDDDRPVYHILQQDAVVLEDGIFSDVVVEIQYDVKRVAQIRGIGTLSTSFATTPAPPKLRHPITSFEITSSVSFGPNYPAGSDVTTFFDVFDHVDSTTPLTLPIRTLEGFRHYLKMNQGAATDIETTLTIEVTLENGEKFSSSTDLMLITG